MRLQAPTPARPGARVVTVAPETAAIRAGLQPGDLIVRINGVSLTSAVDFSRSINSLRGNIPARLVVLRDGRRLDLTYTPNPRSLEQHLNTAIEYGRLTTPLGHTLRTMVTKPKAGTGKLPAILLIQWLSCTSVEVERVEDGNDLLIQQLAEASSHLFMRVEKPGVGDSEGPACADCDLQTELRGYQTALAELKKRPDVDTTRIYLLGMSLGASLAPIVGAGQSIKGYIVTGGCTTTWFEHMLEIERRRLSLSGEPWGQINAKMAGYATLYQRYYVEKMTPQTILHHYPHLTPLWYDAPAHQYGRPASFFHQVQDLNFEAGWSAVHVPTLVIYGEYDWIMSLNDHQKIVQLVNQHQAGLATLIIVSKANHNLAQFGTPQQAFRNEGGALPNNLGSLVSDWLRQH
ncbi:alpha/beta fold hydrolase [Larkinella sp. VNQ87]|uniref:alpha/beta fold hydrolase n=1 Tax=Larkinella sp. VNQ87 TaxID=3400921 RepID=UPI003C02294F